MSTKTPLRIFAASFSGTGGTPSPTYTSAVGMCRDGLARGSRFATSAFPSHGVVALPVGRVGPITPVAGVGPITPVGGVSGGVVARGSPARASNGGIVPRAPVRSTGNS